MVTKFFSVSSPTIQMDDTLIWNNFDRYQPLICLFGKLHCFIMPIILLNSQTYKFIEHQKTQHSEWVTTKSLFFSETYQVSQINIHTPIIIYSLKMKMRRHNLIKQKLLQEQRQTRTILIDFEKAKQKCINLHQSLGLQFETLDLLEAVQRQTELKINILDLQGLIGLKNRLVKTLGELYEIEESLVTKKQRIQVAKQMNSSQQELLMTKNIVKNQMGTQLKRIKSLERINDNHIQELSDEGEFQQIQQPKISNKKRSPLYKQKKIERQKISHRQTSMEIPVYRPKQDTMENRVERISKYIAALKRNMKQNTRLGQKTAQLKSQILEVDPQFNTMVKKLAKYHREEQQFEQLINEKAEQSCKKLIEDFELLNETPTYKLVKIPINKAKTPSQTILQNILQHISREQQQFNQRYQQRERSFELRNRQNYDPKYRTLDLRKINEGVENQEDEDIFNLKSEFSKDNFVMESVVNKIAETLENSERKLDELRERRKKLIMDDDLWDTEN